MRRTLLVGLAALPLLARAQEPPRAPIVATPLMPPAVQYPGPGGQGQTEQAQPGQGSYQGQQQTQPGYVGQQSYQGQQPYQPYQGQQGYPAQQPYQGQPAYPGQPGYQGQPAQQPGIPGQATPAQALPQGQPPAPVQQPPGGQPAQSQPAPGQPGQAPSAGAAAPGPAGQASAEGQPPAAPAPPPPNPWQPQGGAILQALDKVNAVTQTLTVKDGQSVTFGSLSITVQACVIRPPDMPQDAAAFLVIADSHPDEPGFKGWMVKSDPALSMLEHPLYDVRVQGCAP